MEHLSQEQRLLLASALAAAWSDSELHASEERWIALLAEVAGVSPRALDTFVAEATAADALLSEEVAPDVALRVLSAAGDIVVADRCVKPDEERFLSTLGARLGVPAARVDALVASLRELGERLGDDPDPG